MFDKLDAELALPTLKSRLESAAGTVVWAGAALGLIGLVVILLSRVRRKKTG